MTNIKTKHLFKALRIVKEIGLKEEMKQICRKADDVKDVWARGYDLIYMIFEKAVEEKSEQKIYELLADIKETTPEDIANGDAIELIEEFTNGEDAEIWRNFFMQLAKLMKSR